MLKVAIWARVPSHSRGNGMTMLGRREPHRRSRGEVLARMPPSRNIATVVAVTTFGARGLALVGTEPARGLALITGWRRTSKGQPMASGKKNAVARAVAVGATVEVDAAVAAGMH